MSFDLQAAATEFGNEVQALLDGVLPPLQSADPALRQVAVNTGRRTVLIEIGSEAAGKATTIPLLSKGRKAAALFVEYRLVADSADQYLAVAKSEFGLYIDKHPLVRLDFRRDAHSVPCCHWNVHAERGAVTALLTRCNPDHAGELSKVHLPVGGFRMRPCLEDFLHLLLYEFRFDRQPAAQQVIDDGRVRWRRRQLAVMVRDDAETAAGTLAKLGYRVTPPDAGHLEPRWTGSPRGEEPGATTVTGKPWGDGNIIKRVQSPTIARAARIPGEIVDGVRRSSGIVTREDYDRFMEPAVCRSWSSAGLSKTTNHPATAGTPGTTSPTVRGWP